MTALRRLSAPALILALLTALIAAKPWLHSHLEPLVSPVLSGGFDIAVASAAWLVAAWGGARLVDLLAVGNGSRGPDGKPRQPRIPRLLADLLRFFVYGVAVLAILAFVLEQPVTGLLATSGVAIAVLGFALRNMIADIFAGIALNIEHPYRLGDWLELSPGVSGRVDEINWRATRLIAGDGSAIVVPNGIVAGSRFINYSRPGPAFRGSVPVLLDQEVPVERAKRILLSAMLCADGVLPTPRPDVVVEAVGKQWPLDLSAELTRERGRLVVAGYHQDGLRQVNMQLWNWRGLDVINAHEREQAVYVNGIRAAVDAVTSGVLDPRPLYTHSFPLERLADALNATSERPDGFMKALVRMDRCG